MQLAVFVAAEGQLYLQISSPLLKYDRRLFVPLVSASDAILTGLDSNTIVAVWFRDELYKTPYLLVDSHSIRDIGFRKVGEIDENDSRNVLNHILDILAWD